MDDQAVILTYGNTDIPEGTAERPLVTFALFAYNQEKYIREAVEGAFSQTYSPLEIILSDDCSTDRTFEIIKEMAREYRGPHLVKVRRGGANVGTLGHVLIVSRHSRGKLIVVAAGDDVSIPDRTSALVDEFNRTQATALYSKVSGISSGSITPKRLSFNCPFTGRKLDYGLGASAAYQKSFLQEIPLPNSSILHEDILFASIISMSSLKMTWLEMPLVLYRERDYDCLAGQSLRDNIQSVLEALHMRERRIKYFIKLLKYCRENIEIISGLSDQNERLDIKIAEARIERQITNYETLHSFYKSGLIGGWRRIDGVERSNLPEIIRLTFGARFFAVAKGLYLALAR